AREHAQAGRLATTRGTDEYEEFAVVDGEIQLVDRGAVGTRIDPGSLLVTNGRHGALVLSPAGTCRTIRVKGLAKSCGDATLRVAQPRSSGGRLPRRAVRFAMV